MRPAAATNDHDVLAGGGGGAGRGAGKHQQAVIRRNDYTKLWDPCVRLNKTAACQKKEKKKGTVQRLFP